MWKDIDLAKGTAMIRRTYTWREIGVTKTPHGERSIALSPFLVALLREHRHKQKLEQLAAGPDWEEHGLVFMTRRGTPISPRNVLRDFKKLLKRAGLPETCRIHDLRHAMATHWLASGVPPRLVSERMGHASVRFTMDVYGHVIPGEEATAAADMERDLLRRMRAGESGSSDDA